LTLATLLHHPRWGLSFDLEKMSLNIKTGTSIGVVVILPESEHMFDDRGVAEYEHRTTVFFGIPELK
jgi:hypothetical protein